MRSSFSLLTMKRWRWIRCLAVSLMAIIFFAAPVACEARTRPPSKRVLLWAQQNAIRAACLNNIRNLAGLVLLYSRDNQGRLPDFSSPVTLQAALEPYTDDSRIFYCPAGQPYEGNRALSGKKVQDIENFSSRVLLHESTRVHPGGRVTALGDGRVVLR